MYLAVLAVVPPCRRRPCALLQVVQVLRAHRRQRRAFSLHFFFQLAVNHDHVLFGGRRGDGTRHGGRPWDKAGGRRRYPLRRRQYRRGFSDGLFRRRQFSHRLQISGRLKISYGRHVPHRRHFPGRQYHHAPPAIPEYAAPKGRIQRGRQLHLGLGVHPALVMVLRRGLTVSSWPGSHVARVDVCAGGRASGVCLADGDERMLPNKARNVKATADD